MSGLVSFGGYQFTNLQEFDDNFADVQPSTTRIPGMDGGYNQDGDGPAATSIGKITMGFYLVTENRSEMDGLRDEVKAMVHLGMGKLIYQPTNGADPQRFCYARVNYVRMSQQSHEHTDLWQKVQIIFQVPHPRWNVNIYGAEWLIGDGSLLGDVGLVIGGGGYTIAAAGTSTDATIINAGNATTICQIAIQPELGKTCQNPTVQRLVDGLLVDEVVYTGTLVYGDILTFDANTQRAVLNGAPVWDDIMYKHPDFIRLEPGANTIRVKYNNVADNTPVTFYFYDSYR